MPTTIERRKERIPRAAATHSGQIAAIERSMAEDPDGIILLQRVATGGGAMSSLTIYLIEDKLRALLQEIQTGETE
jgi:DNA-binding FrmR family transcriptional regulator